MMSLPVSPFLAAVSERLERFESLIRNELAYNAEKSQRAIRLTVITTLGSALVVACHISSQLGTCLIWVLASTSLYTSLKRASITLAVEGLVLVSSLIMARTLVEAPWALLLYLFVFMSVSTFISTKYQLGSAAVVTQVICLSCFYEIAFTPEQIGWTMAGSFWATAIAFALLALFDNWVWPQPASALLTESLGADMARERLRLIEATGFYLDAASKQRPPEPSWNSDLPEHLALLDRVIAEGTTARGRAILLAAITRLESIHLTIDRLVLAARENVPRRLRSMLQRELEAVVDALEATLSQAASAESAAVRSGADQPRPSRALHARSMWDAFSQRQGEIRPTYIQGSGEHEIANFASFTDSLATLVRLVQRPLDAPIGETVVDRSPSSLLDSIILKRQLIHHAVKIGLCTVIGYVLGLASQRPELSVILITIVITGLPTYGASVRKMELRIIGAILGGLICLLAIFVIAPNSDTISVYLTAIWVVFFLSAYSSFSSGRIAYAGNQIGTTFALTFAGLSPAMGVDGPLWRIWGILLGTLVVTLVFLIFWPDYAGDSLLPRLQTAIDQVISLIPSGRETHSESDVETSSRKTMATVTQILEVAEDARLEGRKCTINHENAVHAAGTLLRIATRLAAIAVGRINNPPGALDDASNQARERVFVLVRTRLEEWCDFYGRLSHSFSRIRRLRLPKVNSQDDLRRPIGEFASRIEANGFRQLDSWSVEQRRMILSEIESLRRLEYLLFELDSYLYGILRLKGLVRS